ncbi:putative HVA22-like protein g isoform X1 [Arachis ipaensis]|uniref:putative HVA22-like protein g isoform X1 n=1 Tax=Arachis ipaensis TaxID=130454 RepID=UPI0007AF0895|nr:putative HVA22-like protein g isoform X1 [Arachis ipaensis]
MIGDFLTRLLILIFGYAYPGFECYKTVEKNKVDIEELRFWCKYWTIVALYTIIEKFVDIFFGWLPFYGEAKIFMFVYLWNNKTKGTTVIYETILKPIISRHESDIDRKILELKARAKDYIVFYWQIAAQYGSGAFVQALQYVASQSVRMTANPPAATNNQKKEDQQEVPISTQPTPINKLKQIPSLSKTKKWPPSPPSSPSATTIIHRGTPKSRANNTEVDDEGESFGMDDTSVRERINKARARLRRLEGSQQSPRTPRTPFRDQE